MSRSERDAAIDRGMRNQLSLRQKLIDQGAKTIGWKAAFGAPQSLEKLGLDAPLPGFLTNRSQMRNGIRISMHDFKSPVIEPEIAIYLGADVPAGASLDEARDAICGIGQALEVADFTSPPDDLEQVLTGNIYHRGLILGTCDKRYSGGEVSALKGRVTINGKSIADITQVETMTGTLGGIVHHFASFLAPFGAQLKKGEIIIAGSIISPIFVDKPIDIEYHLDPIGQLRATFENDEPLPS